MSTEYTLIRCVNCRQQFKRYTLNKCVKMETKEVLHLIGFILGSEYRYKILTGLEQGIRTPKQISKETDIQINHVSNILKELLDKTLVSCKTPDLRKGRLYQITDKGKQILDKIYKI